MKYIIKNSVHLIWVVLFISISTHAQSLNSVFSNQFSYDEEPIMYFIEVEPFEIRVEIMIEGPLLVEILKYPISEKNIIRVDEQENFKNQTREFIENRFTLLLDGIPYTHELARINFLKVGDAESVIKEEEVDEPIKEAVIGASFVFKVKQAPDFLQLTLDELPEMIKRLPARVQALDQTQFFEFNEYLLTLDWNRQGLEFKLPEIKPVEIKRISWLGNPKLNSIEATTVLGKMLDNIYNAFEYHEESVIYDQLAVSVRGEQLASLYLEQKKRMEAVNRGGARVKISEITIDTVTNINKAGDSFVMTGQWEAAGKVTHFGHTHNRKNGYRANFTLVSDDNLWKISDIEVLDENRIQ